MTSLFTRATISASDAGLACARRLAGSNAAHNASALSVKTLVGRKVKTDARFFMVYGTLDSVPNIVTGILDSGVSLAGCTLRLRSAAILPELRMARRQELPHLGSWRLSVAR